MDKPRSYLERLQDLIEQDTDDFTMLQARLILVGRGCYALWRDISQGQLTLRAMSLSFTTLLSLVPLLALSFSVLKGFGIHNTLEPMLLEYLAPLGDKGVELTDKILDFVNNMNVGVLGFMGLGLLLYTVVSLVQKIEESFNYIWNVKESRGFSERFRDYLSAVLIGPFIMMVAFGLSASVKNSSFVQYLLDIETVGIVILMVIQLIPFFMVIMGFTFIYSFMPNTRVKTKAALMGAIVSGILWQSAGWGFTSFVASSTKYTAIYSSFAVLILFLIWLHVSWLLVLIGANISYYYQHPEQLLLARDQAQPSYDSHERLALQIMFMVGKAHNNGDPNWTLQSLADKLFIPQTFISKIVNLLQEQGMLIMTAEDPPAFVPARNIEKISIGDIMMAARCQGEDYRIARECNATVNSAMAQLHDKMAETFGEESLKDFILKSES